MSPLPSPQCSPVQYYTGHFFFLFLDGESEEETDESSPNTPDKLPESLNANRSRTNSENRSRTNSETKGTLLNKDGELRNSGLLNKDGDRRNSGEVKMGIALPNAAAISSNNAAAIQSNAAAMVAERRRDDERGGEEEEVEDISMIDEEEEDRVRDRCGDEIGREREMKAESNLMCATGDNDHKVD